MDGAGFQIEAGAEPFAYVDAPALVPFWNRILLSSTAEIWTLVDDDDHRWLIAWRWNWAWHKRTPWKHYAKRNVGKARSTVYMAREIMRRAEPHDDDDGVFYSTHVVDHINGQSLDNRRANLRWATTTQNNNNALARGEAPTLDAIVAQLARDAARQLVASNVPW